jgi:hypothetical protein
MSSQLGGRWARTPGPASYQQLPKGRAEIFRHKVALPVSPEPHLFGNRRCKPKLVGSS